MRFALVCCMLTAVYATSAARFTGNSPPSVWEPRISQDEPRVQRSPDFNSSSGHVHIQNEGSRICEPSFVEPTVNRPRRSMRGRPDGDVEIVDHLRTMRRSIKQHAKIVGGRDADYTKHPYQLQLAFNGGQTCGATIISREWAVTAAHCLLHKGKRKEAFSITLRAGATTRNVGGRVHGVFKIIIHPQYNETEYDYDIALLKVKRPFNFGTKIRSVALSDADFRVPNGGVAVVSGWGYLVANGTSSPVFQAVSLPIIDQQKCKTNYEKEDLTVTSRMLCAGGLRGLKDFCEGDSGGPLIYKKKLVGIVSWSSGCAKPGFPGVFTRVSLFRDWIRRQTGI